MGDYMFNRDYFITRIKPQYDSMFIKILVGIRSSGKTTLISQIISDIKENDIADDNHIININLELIENEKYRHADYFYKFLSESILDDNQYFVFIDEINYMPKFEYMLKSLSDNYFNLSIFVTCSNSRALPEDLSSVLMNKYKLFYITPLSYSETCKALNTEPHNKNMLLNYLKYGGFPARLPLKKSSEVKRLFYTNLDLIYLKDIVMRVGITDIQELNWIIKALFNFIGKRISINDLNEYFKENNIDIPEHLLYTLLDSLCKALIICECNSYDVENEKILRGRTKQYYFNDLGFGFIFSHDILNNMTATLKNLVWIELKKRGYEVYNGLNGEKSFDFVAIRNQRVLYFQVVHKLEDGNSINKEIEKLQSSNPSHTRYLLSLDKENYSRKGVVHKNIIDFLLEDMNDIETENDYTSWIAVD